MQLLKKNPRNVNKDDVIKNIDFFNISKYQEIVYQNKYPNNFGEIKIS